LMNCDVPVVQVNIGEPVPVLPPMVTPLMIGMSMADWSVPMEGLARKFNVKMTSIEESLRAMLSSR